MITFMLLGLIVSIPLCTTCAAYILSRREAEAATEERQRLLYDTEYFFALCDLDREFPEAPVLPPAPTPSAPSRLQLAAEASLRADERNQTVDGVPVERFALGIPHASSRCCHPRPTVRPLPSPNPKNLEDVLK